VPVVMGWVMGQAVQEWAKYVVLVPLASAV
jgi:hypothetical protein